MICVFAAMRMTLRAMRATVRVISGQPCAHTSMHAVEGWRGLVMPFKAGGVVLLQSEQHDRRFVKRDMSLLMISAVS